MTSSRARHRRPDQSLDVTADGTRVPTGWTVLLPEGWHRIRLSRDRSQQVARLLDRSLASLPRDKVFAWRRDLQAHLDALAGEAHEGGASDLYLLVDLRSGLPVAASCLVTPVPVPLPTDAPAVLIAQILAGNTGRPGLIRVHGVDCPAVIRDAPFFAAAESDIDAVEGDEAPERAQQDEKPTLGLDVYVPFPGRKTSLLLTFRTPMLDLATPMLTLFEAISTSLRWKWA